MKFGKQLELHRSEMIIAFCASRTSNDENLIFFSCFNSISHGKVFLPPPHFPFFLSSFVKTLFFFLFTKHIMCVKIPEKKEQGNSKKNGANGVGMMGNELVLISIIGVLSPKKW